MPRIMKNVSLAELEELAQIDKLNKIPLKDLLPNLSYTKKDDIAIELDTVNNRNFAWVKAKKELETYPIYFICYIDTHSRLRAFVPKHGNLYNPWTYCAFGDESVYANSPKSITNMPKQYYQLNKDTGVYEETEEYKKDFEQTILKENKQMMLDEFFKFVTMEG